MVHSSLSDDVGLIKDLSVFARFQLCLVTLKGICEDLISIDRICLISRLMHINFLKNPLLPGDLPWDDTWDYAYISHCSLACLGSPISATEPGNNYFPWVRTSGRSKRKVLEEETDGRNCLATSSLTFCTARTCGRRKEECRVSSFSSVQRWHLFGAGGMMGNKNECGGEIALHL